MVVALEEVVRKAETKPEVRAPSPRIVRTARGPQQDNSIDLWVCKYDGQIQLSAFVYPTELIVQYKMPLLDNKFSAFDKRKATNEFNEITIEDLNARFKELTGIHSTISHPIGQECYLLSGKKIYEHSFTMDKLEYLQQVIRGMK